MSAPKIWTLPDGTSLRFRGLIEIAYPTEPDRWKILVHGDSILDFAAVIARFAEDARHERGRR